MTAMTFFLIALVLAIGCVMIGSKGRGMMAFLALSTGVLLILFGGYGIFTSFV